MEPLDINGARHSGRAVDLGEGNEEVMNEAVLDKVGGLRPVVGETQIPTTLEEVREVEKLCGAELPASYRQFVMKYGASGFNEYVDYRPTTPFPLASSGLVHISVFYGSEDQAHEGYGLLTRLKFYHGRVPDGMVPIADNGMGDQILLDTKGQDVGRIFFWDHDDERNEADYLDDNGVPMPPEETRRNVFLIATSFDELLNGLEIS